MTVSPITPAGLAQPPTHHQVSLATGTRTIYVAGQVATDADGATVGAGDLAAQVEQVYRNLVLALAGAGATFDDVAKLTLYMIDLNPETMGRGIEAMFQARQALGITATPPLTGIGVSALASPEYLLEIEAVAVLP